MNDAPKDGGTAFPLQDRNYKGMTLRDYFAAQALPAVIKKYGFEFTSAAIAIASFEFADAMIKAKDAPQASEPEA